MRSSSPWLLVCLISFWSPRVLSATSHLTLDVNPASLGATNANSGSLQSVIVDLGNTGSSANFSTSKSASWLSVNPGSGTINTNATVPLTITGNTQGLEAGNYSETVTISGGGSSVTLTVNLTVLGIHISVSTGTLSLSGTSTNPANVTGQFQVTQSGGSGGAIAVTETTGAAWVSINASSGTAPKTFTVTANAANLNQGSYTATYQVTCTSAPCIPKSVNVIFNVGPAPPNLLADGQTQDVLNELSPQAGVNAGLFDTVQLTNSGGSTSFRASASSQKGWLSVRPRAAQWDPPR